MLDLGAIREKIDEVDSELVKLFEKRIALTNEVAEYKLQTGKAVLDKEREQQKLENIKEKVVVKESEKQVLDLFSHIMSNSRKAQYSLLERNGKSLCKPYTIIEDVDKTNCKAVYQGVPGAYAHIATKQFFGEDVNAFNVPTWRDAMEAVKNGEADYAVLPIDNSTTGMIANVYDLLQEYDNYIVGEEFVKVDHKLIGLENTDMSKVTTVYSHPQGIMQCDRFLNEHKDWQRISQPNTAMAAKKVLDDNDSTHVAIASSEAAKLYNLKILEENIIDEDNNTTRFVIVSKNRYFIKNGKTISIVFETKNEAGSLYNLMSHIIYYGLNMNKIESRPIEGKQWEFRFFVDIEANIENQDVINALRGIEEESEYIKILGNY